jgi:hypothetical protein
MYSSVDTLAPGEIYVLGINPGLGRDDYSTIGESLDDLATYFRNAYLDEEWHKDARGAGNSVIQHRMIWLLTAMGYEPRSVCASNLVFVRSKDQSGAKIYASACWPVHLRILSIVRPQLVLTMGKFPFDFLVARCKAAQPLAGIASGHGDWMCRAIQGVIEGRKLTVAAIPHLSRYKVDKHPGVVEWLRGLTRVRRMDGTD